MTKPVLYCKNSSPLEWRPIIRFQQQCTDKISSSSDKCCYTLFYFTYVIHVGKVRREGGSLTTNFPPGDYVTMSEYMHLYCNLGLGLDM